MDVRRSINRNARPTQLAVSLTNTQKQYEELTWECIKGAMDFYQPQPFNQEPEPGDGIWYTHEGHGIMEPRNLMGRLHRRGCPCQSKARKEYEQWKQQQEWARRHTRLCYGWLGERWADYDLLDLSFENYIRSYQPVAYDGVLKYAESLVGALILHGSYGTGKTHLLAALCNYLLAQQTSCLFVTAPDLFLAIQGHISRNEPWEHILNRAILTSFLVLDDIDKAGWSEHQEKIYFAIIDKRVKAGKPTAISTNQLEKLSKLIGGAAESRLSIRRTELLMVGEDFRKKAQK